jgi:hypothetical protein
MRYGPRFGSGGFSSKVSYDEMLDKAMREDGAKMAAIYENMPLYKKELSYHKKVVTMKKNKKQMGHDREEAELRMAEAIHKVVEILEFHMTDMMQHLRVPSHQKHVNQLNIHNVIVELKTRCGVSFDRGGEYERKLSILDEIGGARTQSEREAHLAENRERLARERRAEQEDRNRRLREMAERLKARPKGQA